MAEQYKRYEKGFKLEAAKLATGARLFVFGRGFKRLGVSACSIRDWTKALQKSGALPACRWVGFGRR